MIADVGKTEASLRRSRKDCKAVRAAESANPKPTGEKEGGNRCPRHRKADRPPAAARTKHSEVRISREDKAVEAASKTRMAGVTGFEPVALGFGDRCSTS